MGFIFFFIEFSTCDTKIMMKNLLRQKQKQASPSQVILFMTKKIIKKKIKNKLFFFFPVKCALILENE